MIYTFPAPLSLSPRVESTSSYLVTTVFEAFLRVKLMRFSLPTTPPPLISNEPTLAPSLTLESMALLAIPPTATALIFTVPVVRTAALRG